MILVAIPHNAGVISQIQIATELEGVGETVHLWLTVPQKAMSESGQFFLQNRSWPIHNAPVWDTAIDITDSSHLPSQLKKLHSSLVRNSGHIFVKYLDIYGRRLKDSISLLKSLRPKAVLIASDGTATDLVLASAAKRLKIPIVCCPYGYCSPEDLENDLLLKKEAGRLSTIEDSGGEIVNKKYPQWVKKGKMAGHLLHRPEVILAMEAAGVSLRSPWNVYGSEADIMCVPSVQYKEHLIRLGFPDSKIHVTGSPNGMRIFKVLENNASVRKAFRKAVKISDGKTRILISMPPNYHATRGKFSNFANYEDLLHGVTGVIRNRKDIEFTISAHPSTKPEDMACYARLGLTVLKGDVIDQIPQHDLFVTDFSSTVRWAIACGKPVINYDFYNFYSTVYEGVEGFINISRHEEYETLINRFVSDEEFFCQIASKQSQVADEWGRIDSDFIFYLQEALRSHSRKRDRFNFQVKRLKDFFKELLID